MLQKKGVVFRPLTEADLMAKYHNDQEYVSLVIADCVSKKRFKEDELTMDKKRRKYWVTRRSQRYTRRYQVFTTTTSTACQ
jgi:hypothetical protein